MGELTAVYIGRFHPFGRHHRTIVQFIDSESDVKEIVIVKGSAQWSDRNPDPNSAPAKNPFTAEECCSMIDLSLAGRIKKPYRIVIVADTKTKITDPFWKEWVKDVISAVGSAFTVYVNEPRIVQAFAIAGIECRPFPVGNLGPRASVIREKIAFEPESEWSKYVDSEVADYIKEIRGPERIRRLLANP